MHVELDDRALLLEVRVHYTCYSSVVQEYKYADCIAVSQCTGICLLL